jgi:hypothetical protein
LPDRGLNIADHGPVVLKWSVFIKYREKAPALSVCYYLSIAAQDKPDTHMITWRQLREWNKMIIEEDGSYYILHCEKCGAGIRKHKSYCSRYGEAYHFNPELKCDHCGFSAKVVYGGSASPPSPASSGDLQENGDKIQGLKCNRAQNSPGNQEYPAEKAVTRVVLTGGIQEEKFINEKGMTIEEETENCPEFIKKRIDIKVETLLAADNVLEKFIKKKTVAENAKLMVITDFGVVEGTLKLEVESHDAAQRISLELAKARNNRLAEMEREVRDPIITNNHFFVTILNARVMLFANPNYPLTFASLNLFADKIVGFTFGELEQEKIGD